jgi:protein-S-isoprenylcysteine O-methyltransferase Ste14
MTLLKTAAQAALFWALFLVAVPLGIRAAEVQVGLATWALPHPALVVVGIAVLVAASTLNLAAAWALAVHGDGTPLPLDPTRRLVIRGPYRWVRNPMAVAGIGQGVGVGILLGSPIVLGYALAGAVVWQLLVRPWEEAELLARFGTPYAEYRSAVRCWLPRRHPVAAVGETRSEETVGPDGLEPPTSSV